MESTSRANQYLLLIDVPDLTGKSPKNCTNEQVDSFLTRIENMGAYDVQMGIPSENLMMVEQEADVNKLLAERNLRGVWDHFGKNGLHYDERNTFVISDKPEWSKTPYRKNVLCFDDKVVTGNRLKALEWVLYQMSHACPSDVRDFFYGWNRPFASGSATWSQEIHNLMEEPLGSDEEGDGDEAYEESSSTESEPLNSLGNGDSIEQEIGSEKVNSNSDTPPFDYESLLEAISEIGKFFGHTEKEILSEEKDDKRVSRTELSGGGSADFMERGGTEGGEVQVEKMDADEDCSDSSLDLNGLKL